MNAAKKMMLGLTIGAPLVMAAFVGLVYVALQSIGKDLDVVVFDGTLAVLGAYLLVYRIFSRTRCKDVVRGLSNFACGASVMLLTPLMSDMMSSTMSVSVLAVVGAFFGICIMSPCVPLLSNVTTGAFVGALVWQGGLCGSIDSAFQGVIVGVSMFVLVGLLVCTPIGFALFEPLLVPMLASALLTSGLAGLLPSVGALAPTALFSQECAEEGAVLVSLGAWFAVTIVGAAFKLLLNKTLQKPVEEENKVQETNQMAKQLLPEATGEASLIPRTVDEEAHKSRFLVLVTAMYAPEFASQDHLTQEEKDLVNCCRKDEFERDRVVWGGGLI